MELTFIFGFIIGWLVGNFTYWFMCFLDRQRIIENSITKKDIKSFKMYQRNKVKNERV